MDPYLDSGEWRALVAAIRFDPNDDTCRLVAADWLQEQNADDLCAWGQFIRCQVERAWVKRDHVFNDACDCDACRPERRWLSLYDQWGYYWFARLIIPPSPLAVIVPMVKDYVRGFVEKLNVNYRSWKVNETPFLVRDLFARTPLVRAKVSLDADRPANFPSNQAREYLLSVDVLRTRSDMPYLQVRAELAIDSEVNHIARSRIVAPKNKLDRAITGAIRSVVSLRNELDGAFVDAMADRLRPIPEPVLGGEA